jgi:hypothetical protein
VKIYYRSCNQLTVPIFSTDVPNPRLDLAAAAVVAPVPPFAIVRALLKASLDINFTGFYSNITLPILLFPPEAIIRES